MRALSVPGVRGAWRADRPEPRTVLMMAGAVLSLHLVGWTAAVLVLRGEHHVAGGAVFGIGLGATAYMLGIRHAFDADHIAAIDNTTRKLLADKASPLSVGFWFSLGHSTVVFVMVSLLATGVRALATGIANQHSALRHWTALLGTSVAGIFLILIGLLNLVSLIGIGRVLRALRRGHYDERRLEEHLADRGAIARLLAPLLRTIRHPWQMYPVGLLFGVGFDTVSEVSLLVLAGGAATTNMPWYAILVLPVLFSAGMSLFDSLDGVGMNYAYGWAFVTPIRKIYYNLVVTGLSVAVALLIGVQEIISVLTGEMRITSGPLAWIGKLDMGSLGFVIVGLFAVTWAVALLVWRFGNVERRWHADLAGETPP